MRSLLIVLGMVTLILGLAYATDQTWTFVSDAEGWNSPSGTWNTTITWDASTHTADGSGSIQCTDTDNWYGVRNTLANIGAGNPEYKLTVWGNLMDIDETWGLYLQGYQLDSGPQPHEPFDIYTTGTWQEVWTTGTANSAGAGYIMICTDWNSPPDPATIEFYIDDVDYDEVEPPSVSDWSLYSSDVDARSIGKEE